MGNFTSKVNGEKKFSFGLMMDASLLFKAFVMFPNQDTISSLLEPYIEKGSSKGDLMKVFKEAHVMFQAECVGNVYMLWNSEVTVGGLQLSSASKAVVVE